jgi:hypothetical protein
VYFFSFPSFIQGTISLVKILIYGIVFTFAGIALYPTKKENYKKAGHDQADERKEPFHRFGFR